MSNIFSHVGYVKTIAGVFLARGTINGASFRANLEELLAFLLIGTMALIIYTMANKNCATLSKVALLVIFTSVFTLTSGVVSTIVDNIHDVRAMAFDNCRKILYFASSSKILELHEGMQKQNVGKSRKKRVSEILMHAGNISTFAGSNFTTYKGEDGKAVEV